MAKMPNPHPKGGGLHPQAYGMGALNVTARRKHSSPDTTQLMEAVVERGNMKTALTGVLAKRGLCPTKAMDQVVEALRQITPQEVYLEEENTRHNIQALMNCLRKYVNDDGKSYIHLAATSMDILETANNLRFKAAA